MKEQDYLAERMIALGPGGSVVGSVPSEGRRFESHSSCHVGTLRASLVLPVAFRRVNSDTAPML